MDLKRDLRVGVAIGQGTGMELAEVFERVLANIASYYSLEVQFNRSSRIYHSYSSLFSAGDDYQHIYGETMKDAADYESFCTEEALRGTCAIFRTAITAQSLYMVRQHLEAVKVEYFSLRQGSATVLLVRDQAQGFYTGSNKYDAINETLARTCQFSKRLTSRIVSYSLRRAYEMWGENAIDCVTMVYKHHLFDGIFDVWAKDLSDEHDIGIKFIQPDTMNRNLLAFGVQGHQLVIASNEYADIMQAVFLDTFDQGVQETSCAENVYLHPEMHDLSEYQTVHGSADDLMGKAKVNPSATMKAAAAILERHGSCSGVEKAMNRAIETLLRQNNATPDQGGCMTTSEFVDATLADLANQLSPSSRDKMDHPSADDVKPCVPDAARMTMGMNTALLVIDFQNDFASSLNEAAPDAASHTALLATNISRVIKSFRAQHHEVIFLRFLGDLKYQFPNWQYRDHILDRKPWCLAGTIGADFIAPVQPALGERVFDKRARFDAFLSPGFEAYLKERGYEHLVLLGLYCDVCVDTTARTAFQKGFYVTVVEDCTLGLHFPVGEWKRFASMVYGTRVLTWEKLVGMKK